MPGPSIRSMRVSEQFSVAWRVATELHTAQWVIMGIFGILPASTAGVDRPAVDGIRPAKSAEARMGDRKEAGGGRCLADHLLRPRRDVLAVQTVLRLPNDGS